MIAETQSYIFRWRFRSVSSTASLLKLPNIYTLKLSLIDKDSDERYSSESEFYHAD